MKQRAKGLGGPACGPSSDVPQPRRPARSIKEKIAGQSVEPEVIQGKPFSETTAVAEI